MVREVSGYRRTRVMDTRKQEEGETAAVASARSASQWNVPMLV
jgi:hypothetical protein